MKYILSLTSHPPRFHSLELVLLQIDKWKIKPQSIFLNLSADEAKSLPKTDFGECFSRVGLISITDNLGPGKKMIPTIEKIGFNSIVVTIDDDVHYSPSLIQEMESEHKLFPNSVLAGRARRILRNNEGKIAPYKDWHLISEKGSGPKKDLFPTGVGMVLYPPKSLHSEFLDKDVYRENCFLNDDFWNYFHARRQGSLIRKINGTTSKNDYIEDTQQQGLWSNGAQERNDVYMRNLLQIYGNPLELS